MIVQCALLNTLQYYHRDSSVNISLPPDKHHCSDKAKWRLGVRWESSEEKGRGRDRKGGTPTLQTDPRHFASNT